MARRNESEYIFADAYICSYMKDLMTKSDLIRLANCPDFDSAESLLRDFGYGESPEVRMLNVEAFIRREQTKLFQMIYNTLPERAELALYLYPYDYHNVKVCLKSEILGIIPDDNLLMTSGDIDFRRMMAMVRDRSYEFMPVNMKDAVIEALDLYSRSRDPQEIDIIMDKACYKDMLEAAEESKEEFLIGFVKHQIDLLNLKVFARLREMGKAWSFFRRVYLPDGNISENFYIESWEESYAQVAEKLVPYGYGLSAVMAEGGAQIKEKGSFTLYEKMLEDSLMEYNKKAKYLSFGLVPIAGYWIGKEVELDNIRIILMGMLAGESHENIEERLREPYV